MRRSLAIPKICIECNKAFIAKTSVTKFCSAKCNSKTYKKNKNKKIAEIEQKQEYEKTIGDEIVLIQSKEYLSIKETCLLLGISRMSLYRYIKNKTIIPSSIGGKVIIKKEVITDLIK